MPTVLPALLLAVFAASAPSLVSANDAKPPVLPVDYFYKAPELSSPALSPNGRYLATTTRKKGVMQLAVVDLQTNEAKMLVGYADLDIAGATWLDDERLAYSVVDRSVVSVEPGGLYTVARTGGKPVALIQTRRDLSISTMVDIVSMELVRPSRKDPRKLLVVGRIADGGDARPLLVDSVNGKRTEIDFHVPGKPLNIFFDSQDEVRAAITSTGEDLQTLQLWFHDPATSKWRMLVSTQQFDPKISPAGMVGDTLYVNAPAGPHWGLYKYDMVNNKLGELVLADPEVDVGSALVVARDRDVLLGVRLLSEPPRTHWFDPAYAALQVAVDRAHPKHINMIVPNQGDAPRQVVSFSSTDPFSVRRYDPATKKLSTLFRAVPWVEPDKMAETLVYDYKARDGLPIMSYLTLPKGRTPKNLPLIVFPHGGPQMRDLFGFNRDVQFLANRGYVVLQPQFRGSKGLGVEHEKKGYRQWGLAMQDDVTDGVRALVQQEVVDPKRVCIMGYSYGGYATMMGLAKDPDQYRCGINLVGVTDLTSLLKEGRWGHDSFRHFASTTIGDLATMKAQIERTSPVNRAADIKAPVFMAYGEKDRRVPLAQGTDMRDALKKAGKTFEWMSFANEEHTFVHEENLYKVANGIDAFLKKYNPAD